MVKIKLILLVLLAVTSAIEASGSCDVYFITYATRDGNTGHSGLAVDNYLICVYDRVVNGKVIHDFDTVKTGTLVYFDFWPAEDHFSIRNAGRNTTAKYNRLPAASYEKQITLGHIVQNGIPHIKNYPCDGVLRLATSPAQDYDLIHFMDSIAGLERPFNVRRYNCSDFVLAGACHITGREIRAKEFIPFSFSTTPNMLYRKLRELTDIEVIVDPGNKISGGFFRERILDLLLTRIKIKERENPAHLMADQNIIHP